MKRLFPPLFCSLWLTVCHAQLFYDSFARATDPGSLTPWTAQSNSTWSVIGGQMESGLNTTFSYADATITNIFVNCTVQGRFKFPSGAFGGGLGGRLNPTTGAHYAAWIYPENSTGGSNVLRLLKFQAYNNFGYQGNAFAPIAEANLASVGTNFHLLRMDFSTNRILVYLDGVAMINAQDTEATYYTNGSVSLDMWTDVAPYDLSVDDVVVANLGLSANNDTNILAATGILRSIPAPGVLANDTGGNAPLSALLAAAPTHGTLSLSNNGGFTYVATNGFAGNETFTYRVTDGVSTSATATVTITVTPDNPPVANSDSYSVLVNSALNIPAPGVLANDTDMDGNPLTAILVANPANGSVILTNNGGFTYIPNNGFLGIDTFTYRANDGQSNSAPATVTISVQPPALFSDNFTRGTDPGPLDPWQIFTGTWRVTGGTMKGGTNSPSSYGFAYITNSYGNYSVQARVQFPAGAFGGGLGGRLDPVSGAHYGAWIYPENSPGGSNILRLIKFQNYTTFSYQGVGGPIAEVNLPPVGTNFHTVKLGFFLNRIAVYFDGVEMISVYDQEATPYLTGSVSLDMWTDAAGYVMSLDDVIVNPLAVDDNYTMAAGTTLTVPNAGVLSNDTDVFGTNLSASLISPTIHGSLTFSLGGGGFTYTPTNGFVGVDSFTYEADEAATNIGTATANITVFVVNNPPAFAGTPPNQTINELTSLSVTNPATDPDADQTISYQLASPPAGVTIDTNGVITWTPTEAQGPRTFTITTVATDNGTPPKSATNSFTVTVLEVNSPPVLPMQTDQTINELTSMRVVNTATDPDLPVNTLTYSFLSAPTGAAISSSGVITWTPSEAQGPGTNTFTIRVVDNGSPPLSDTNTFTVTVNEVNSAPVLPAQTNRTIAAQTPLTIVNTATDSDIPTNNLTYLLLAAPNGASISPDGIITWTPAPEQDNSTNLFRTAVTDDGTPPLSATNVFTVFVNSNAVVVLDSSALVLEGCTPTNNAIDPGETVTMTFAFKNLGTGPTTNLVVTLLETNGVVMPSAPQTYGVLPVGGAIISQPFTFSASGTCGGSINPILRLQDGAASLPSTNLIFPLGAYTTILTQNFDSVTAPDLPAGWTTTSSGLMPNWRTTNSLADTAPNAAFSPDVTNVGLNELISPQVLLPPTPSQLTFNHRYDLESSALNASLGFDGGVLEIKIGANDFVDITNAGGTFVSGGYTKVISGSFDSPLSNRPAWSGTINNYTNTVVNLPAVAAGQIIQLRWRCASDNGQDSQKTFAGWRIDSIGIAGTVCCQNTAPILAAPPDQTIQELTTLIVTNAATDSSTPPSGLTYSLMNAPDGATIDTNGIITWTPSEAQGPGTNVLTTVVTDNGSPPLGTTNSFTVTVVEVNSAPVLPAQADRKIVEQTTLIVTNTATDSDIPANSLSYLLLSAPAAASIDANGVVTWPTTEADGPGVYTITTVVTDDGSPPLSATNTFAVTVDEVNTAPILAVPSDQTINELTTLSVSASATDSDIPANTLTFSLLSPPSGMSINLASGAINWTPTEAQGPSTNTIVVVVTDNGSPALSATNSFIVTVNEVNSAPALPIQPDITIAEGATLLVTNTASDSDIPTNILSYALLDPPTGAQISSAGVISWTPTHEQAPGTNIFETVVTDNGVPAMTATNSFTVVVTASEVVPPAIQFIALTNGVVTISWTSVTGRNYRLLYTGELNTNWLPIPPDIMATNSSVTATDSVEAVTTRFYRVQLLP